MLISISEIIQINCIEIYIKNPKFTVDHSFDFELYLYSALISQMKSYEIYFVVYGNQVAGAMDHAIGGYVSKY